MSETTTPTETPTCPICSEELRFDGTTHICRPTVIEELEFWTEIDGKRTAWFRSTIVAHVAECELPVPTCGVCMHEFDMEPGA
jgi:hypothetical protein